MFTEAKKELECKEKSLADFLDQMLLDAGNIDHLQVTYEDPPENATTSTVQLVLFDLSIHGPHPVFDYLEMSRLRPRRNLKIARLLQPYRHALEFTPTRSFARLTSFLFSSRPHDLPVIATPRPTFNDRLRVNETQLDRLTATPRNERAASDVELHYTSVLDVEVTGASVSGDQTGQDQGKPRHP
ncbi:hypothetical protein B0H14DRAFT_3908657 [Mycena olivaceomarginata]|nr:hypothetical protein B0H14DRAFT_3908657 [Mycena olivaceomarginata]